MGLDRYGSMRDFGRTPEPSAGAPEVSAEEAAGRPRFVVQEHHATSLHWDLRLERGGVLVSWAVPKGLPPDPRVNHLAVHTEDHPLSYYDFEGEIPAGEYGGGRVLLWDQGTYEEEKFTDREVRFVLNGRRARGRHVLICTGGTQWLLHRMDPPEDPSRELVPEQPVPSQPEAVPELPGPAGEWVFEPVVGGVRVAVVTEGGRPRAHTAEGADVTGDWPVLRRFAADQGTTQMVVEGELARSGRKDPGSLYVSDLLWLEGHGTTALPWSDRRRLLEGLELEGEGWRTTPVYDDGTVLLEAARAQSLPAILARRPTSPWHQPPRLVRP